MSKIISNFSILFLKVVNKVKIICSLYSFLNIPVSIFIGVGLNYSSADLIYSKNSKIATWLGNIQKQTEEWPSNSYNGQGMGYQMQIASKFDLFPRLGVHFSYYIN